MRVGEFLAFAARLRGVAAGDVFRRVGAVEELTALTDRNDDPISTLSHGYQQRVGIAQAIIHEPKLVVLDEPISGLDPVQIVEMRQLVRTLGGKHTVLLSSHILQEISETCDRLLVIKDGEIVASGTETELSSKLLEGVRVRVALRAPGSSSAVLSLKAKKALGDVAGVIGIEDTVISESSDEIAAFIVEAKQDVRAAVAAAAVSAGFELLELGRLEHELESVFLRLAGSTRKSAATENGAEA
jgi:ABC-2 type transport system ATP-binding protein